MDSLDYLSKLYSQQELKEIAKHGCVTGVATHHIHYHETEDFFNKFEDEVLDFLENLIGENPIHYYSKDSYSIQELINKIVWSFVEQAATHLTESE